MNESRRCFLNEFVLIKSQCWKFNDFVIIPFYLVVSTYVLWLVSLGKLIMLGAAVVLHFFAGFFLI